MLQDDLQKLVQYADSIPSMGGRQIKEYIFAAVKDIEEGTAIVELGTWCGAGTAQIALALMYYGKTNPIYTYDKFIAKGRQGEKASKEGWDLKNGEDFLPKVKKALSVFSPYVNITFNKGLIKDFPYEREYIGLYIDDAVKQKNNFDEAIMKFSPHFIPNKTILIMMDFYLWKNTGEEGHKYQYYYMQENKKHFQIINESIDTSYQGKVEEGAIFKYLGGLN